MKRKENDKYKRSLIRTRMINRYDGYKHMMGITISA